MARLRIVNESGRAQDTKVLLLREGEEPLDLTQVLRVSHVTISATADDGHVAAVIGLMDVEYDLLAPDVESAVGLVGVQLDSRLERETRREG